MARSARVFALAVSFLFCLAAEAADKLTVGALTFVSSAPIFIAQDKGYFAAEGLEVEIKFFQAAQPVAVAVAGGDADLGITGLTGGFYNLAGKGALKIVAAQSREEPGFDFTAYLASTKAYEAGLRSVEKLPGHSFAMTQIGSTFHYTLGRLAEVKGFKLDQVSIKPLQSVPNMVAAIKSGQVDATALPAHIANDLHAKGEAKLIGWVHETTPWQLGALFANTKQLETRRPVIARFVKAYVRACNDYAEAFHERDAAGKRAFGAKADALIPIIATYTKAERNAILGGAPFIDPKGRLKVADIYEQVRWYKAQNLVDPAVDAKAFLDLSFVPDHLDLPKN
jgi:NitT/TauT family transport system substrate-binding protein